jgi:hypothetical protein
VITVKLSSCVVNASIKAARYGDLPEKIFAKIVYNTKNNCQKITKNARIVI